MFSISWFAIKLSCNPTQLLGSLVVRVGCLLISTRYSCATISINESNRCSSFGQLFIPLVLIGSNSFNIYYYSCWLQIMIIVTTLTNTLFGLGGLSAIRVKLTNLVLNT